MSSGAHSPYLDLLRDQIDIAKVPFSDRGSRILVFREPDKSRLYVRIAERVPGIETGTERFAFRPPLISDLCLTDQSGRGLDFRLSVRPDRLQLTTRLGEFGLAFYDRHTLAVGPPTGVTAGLRFRLATRADSDPGSASAASPSVATSCKTNGYIVRQESKPDEGGLEVEIIVGGGKDLTITIPITVMEDSLDSPQSFTHCLAAAEARWSSWFGRVPTVAAEFRIAYARAWWVLACNLAEPGGPIGYEAVMPSKPNYVGLWLWDCAFHALALRHIDPILARNQLRVMLDHQRPSGMLPDALADDGPVFEIDHPFRGEVTKPPLFAWAALKLHETAPDKEFLAHVYPPLTRLNGWWFGMNDDDRDGLAQYNHPYSSGLDDSPLWDYGMPVESPDLNTYLCVEMDALARIADILGLDDEAQAWRLHAEKIVTRMLEDFWDEEAGYFRALHEERPISVLTPFNLLPLWTGRLPAPVKKRLIEHLTDPDEFWCEYGVPTVARNDPHYDPQQMWRGPTWINVNYLLVEALHRCDRADLARQLRDRTLRLVMGDMEMSEYFDSRTGRPADRAARMFSWTAAAFIDLALMATAEAQPRRQRLRPAACRTRI